jgi:tetratricopeptide (TPR) repeat protein
MRGAAGHVFSFALSAAIALGAVLSSLVASPLAAQDADRRARAADLVVLGERFAQAGDRVSARAYFRDAISADPSYAPAYVALGELELARAAYRDAEATFRVGILRAHAEARLWVGLARALDALEAPADADAVLAQADAQLRGDPDLLAFCVARAERYESGRRSLPGALLPADEEAFRGDRSLTRTHLARELVRVGVARDVREAFARVLSDAHHRVPPVRSTFEEVIEVARAFGGFTSWAHPAVGLVDRALPRFVAAGLQGLEADRPLLSTEDRRRLRRAAERHGLYLTGGSDWHGWGDDADLGLFRVESARLRPFLDAFGPMVALAGGVE